MVRMLHIVGSMSPSGIGNFIMNIYRNMDRNKLQFDFIVHEHREVSFDEEITALGGRLYYVTRKSVSPLKNFLEIKNVVKKGGYEIVFRHTDTATVALDLLAAKWGGAKRRIPHSHSTGTSNVRLHRLFMPLLNAVSTDCFACSRKAGEWLYGHNRFEVILNGIRAEEFSYSQQAREQVRAQEGLGTGPVFGHVGNLLPVKNHLFLLEVLAQLVRRQADAKLLFVGDGAMREAIEKRAKELGVSESLVLCGVRDDTARLLQAMDLFFFPSFYEGMPIALVEAQAAGLPCLISEAVTDDVIVTELVTKLPIPPGQNRADGKDTERSAEARRVAAEQWAVTAIRLARETVRRDTAAQIRESGFSAKRLAAVYEKLAEG